MTNKLRQELESSLYRILSFDRLVEIFQNRELFLSHPSNWEDPYETVLDHKHSSSFFAQCWCKHGVSDAMWRIYSPNQLAVRIRTTKERLEQELNAAAMKHSLRFIVKDVEYLPQMKLKMALQEAAEQLFTSAMGAGDVVNYNLGIIKIKQGDYAAAVNYFGNKPSFNAGLANLLNGDTDKAIATLGELGDSDDAMVYYLKAVAGARSNDENTVMSNLRIAVEKDASLKDHAKKDAEFRNFATKEGFTAIVQ